MKRLSAQPCFLHDCLKKRAGIASSGIVPGVVRRLVALNFIGMTRLTLSGAWLSSERLQCLRLVLTTDSTFSLGKSCLNVMVTSRVLLAAAL